MHIITIESMDPPTHEGLDAIQERLPDIEGVQFPTAHAIPDPRERAFQMIRAMMYVYDMVGAASVQQNTLCDNLYSPGMSIAKLQAMTAAPAYSASFRHAP